MSVLIEAKGSQKVDGLAFMPHEPCNKQRLLVRVVDSSWRSENWPAIKRVLTKSENARLVALLRLRGAIYGKSSDAAHEAKAVVSLSKAMEQSWAAALKNLEEHGKDITTADGRPFGRVHEGPMSADDNAVSLLIDLQGKPRELLAAEMTIGLRDTKPCVWLDHQQQFQFGLFCPNTLSAIYATAMLREGVACCLRCGQFFPRTREDKQFCTPRCQNTFLTARRRRQVRERRAKAASSGRNRGSSMKRPAQVAAEARK